MRFILLNILITLSATLMAQDNLPAPASSDSLVWSIYIGGKSDMSNRPYEEAIAKNWGIHLVYFFGDCIGTYDYKNEEFKESNKTVFQYLTENFGEDWYTKFNQEVTALRKESEK